MRDVKFRAWHNDKMFPVEDISQAPKYRTWLGHIDVDVLMQYTGLKDKNGVEIYEGDIISYTWQSNWGSRERIERLFTVVYKDGQFLQLEQDEEVPDHWYEWDSLEVIGNIYENPELIKAAS